MNVVDKDYAWKVYFGCGFGKHHGRDHAGTEIRIVKQFDWYDALWYIPSVYICGAGLVIDICVQIAPEKIKAFYDKWEWAAASEEKLTAEEIEKIEAEDPMRKYYGLKLQVNGNKLQQHIGSSMRWIPECCQLEGFGQYDEEEWEAILAHYQLDPSKGWLIHRHSLPWNYKRKPVIRSLELHLEQHREPVICKKFVTPCVGLEKDRSISAVHPLTGQVHTITIKGLEQQELDASVGREQAYEFPGYFYRMDYTLEPDLPGCVYIRDCRQSDPPRKKAQSDAEGASGHSASSIGIIGGADGPTAIFVAGVGKREKLHVACSALHFEPVDQVEWKIEFQVKRFEDVKEVLI